MKIPDVHFRPLKDQPIDWRDPKFEDKIPDDDEELDQTPSDVVKMLGFDPKEKDQ